MKKFISLLLCVLMLTSMANFSSLVNAVTSIELPTVDEVEKVSEEGLIAKTITGFYNGYTVEVSGMLPQVANLSLTSVNNDSAQKLVDETNKGGKAVFACDIKILDAEGNEWQPFGNSVEVKVTGIDKTDKTVQFLHISEDIETVLAEGNPVDSVQTITDVTEGENGEVSFDTSGFSTFVGFTVDFHYNGKTFSIGGMENVLLSEVFAQLNIDKNVADAIDVTFTDESLVKVDKEGDDWRLTSLKAFNTEENLKVTFKDGEVLNIAVTDATATITIGGASDSGTNTAYGGANFKIAEVSVDDDPTTVNTYKVTGYMGGADSITINIAGHVQFLKSSNDLFDGAIGIKGNGQLTVNNTYGEDAYVFAGTSNTAAPVIWGAVGTQIKITGSENARLIFDGRQATALEDISASNITEKTRSSALVSIKSIILESDKNLNSDEEASELTLDYVTFQNNKSTIDDEPGGAGGAFMRCYFSSANYAGDLSVKNCKFYNLTSTATLRGFGMGIAVRQGNMSTFEVENCYFEKCTTTSTSLGGGAIGTYETNLNTNLVLTKNRFVDCSAENFGGAMYFQGNMKTNDVLMTNNAFKNCEVFANDGRGGAVIFSGSSNISQADIKFLYDDDFVDSDIKMSDGSTIKYEAAFENCKTLTSCSGYKLNDKTKTPNSYAFARQLASGGAIQVDTNTPSNSNNTNSFQILVKPGDFDTKSVFKNCQSFLSAAIGINPIYTNLNTTKKTLDLTNENVFDSITIKYGEDASVEVDGDTIDGNARDGILPAGRVTTTNPTGERTAATFKDCTATLFGGVMFLPFALNGKFLMDGIIADGCKSTEGSFLSLWSTGRFSNFIIRDSVVKNCDTAHLMGHIDVFGGTIRTKGKTVCKMDIINTAFDNNDSYWYGGAIYWIAAGEAGGVTSDLSIKNSRFTGNRAGLNGGAIMCEAEIGISNTIFEENSALFSGGAISVNIHRDTGEDDPTQLPSPEEIDLSIGAGCEFNRNEAGVFGGGVSLEYRYSEDVKRDNDNKYTDGYYNYGFTMRNTFTDDDDLNGVFGDYTKNEELPEDLYPKMVGNVAGVYGGALYYGMGCDRDFTTNDTTGEIATETITSFDFNGYSDTTKDNFVNNKIQKSINIKAGIIRDNIAGYDGGGLYVKGDNATVTLEKSEFTGNSAGVTEYRMNLLTDEKKIDSTTIYEINPSTKIESYRLKGVSQPNLDEEGNPDGTYFQNREVSINPANIGCGGAIALKGTSSRLNIYGSDLGAANPDATDTSLLEEKYRNANKADFGGAIAIKNGTINMYADKVNAENTCSITNNYSAGGGAIFTMGSGTVKVNDGADISNNYADGLESIVDTAYSPEFSAGVEDVVEDLCTTTTDRLNACVTADRKDGTNGNWLKGSGGGVYAYTGTVSLIGGSVFGNTALDGAGGGVFAHYGGSVSMSNGKLYNNVAHYISEPDVDTAFESATLKGVGGAIALGDGKGNTTTNLSTFSLSGTGYAIYNNTADFAADDVYASGLNTQLTVPDSSTMDIPGIARAAMTYGWYEDFYNQDSEFENAKSISSASESAQVQRYRTGMNKILIPDVDSTTDGASTYVTAKDAYVCMTLGITKAGALQVSKNVVDKFNNVLNDSYIDEIFNFTVTANSAAAFPEEYSVYLNDVLIDNTHDYYPEIIQNDNTVTFGIRAGMTVAMNVMGIVTVEEVLDERQKAIYTPEHAVSVNGTTTVYNDASTEELNITSQGLYTSNNTEVVFNNEIDAKGQLEVSKFVVNRQGESKDDSYSENYTFNIIGQQDADTGNYADMPVLVALYDADGNRVEGSAFDAVNNAAVYDENTHTYTFTIANGYKAVFEAAGEYKTKEVLGENQEVLRTTYIVKDVDGVVEKQNVETLKPYKVFCGNDNTVLAYYNMLAKFYGQLKIGKNVIDQFGNNLDDYYTNQYTFTVTGYENAEKVPASGLEFVGIYNADNTKITDAEAVSAFKKAVTVNEGNTTFKLSNGQYVVFKCDGDYAVVESESDDVIATEYKINNGDAVDSETTDKFTVSEDNNITVNYTNIVKAVGFEFKYYDRKLEGGKAAALNDTETTVKVYLVGDEFADRDVDKSGSLTGDELSKAILYASKIKLNDKISNNIIDSYTVFTSQSDAAGYNDGNHYGPYREVYTGDGDKQWVTWHTATNKVTNTTDNARCVVWLYSNAQDYKVKIHALATEKEDATGKLTKVEFDDGTIRYVCNSDSDNGSTIAEFKAKYNQLIGSQTSYEKLGEDDRTTTHLTKYGCSKYTGNDYKSAEEVTYQKDDNKDGKNDTLYFSHWSFDADGSTVASTDYEFHYRVTSDMTVYAVYTDSVDKTKGLTVSAETIDTFIDGNNKKTRLNTVVNPYNFEDNAGNSIIKNLAGVYVVADKSASITPDVVAQLQEKIKKQLEDWRAEDYTENKMKSAEIEGVTGVNGANFVVYYNPVLSNKNRVNMTAEFSNTTLADKRLLTFAALNYTYGENASDNLWRISDNCIDYVFDTNGESMSVTSIYESAVKE